MNGLARRQALGIFATSGLAVIGGIGSLFPEARMLRANAATAMFTTPDGRGLRGRVMTPGALSRALIALQASSRGGAGLALARSEGFAPQFARAYGVDVDWDDGTNAGSVTIVPGVSRGRHAMLARRVSASGELLGIALERDSGWVDVMVIDAAGTRKESSFLPRADGTVLVRGSDGSERTVTPPRASASGAGARLASPLADDPIQQICSTVCNWYLGIVCNTFWLLTGFFVCAWVTVDSLGTLALACAMVFFAIDYVVCSTVPQWACSQVCTW